MYHIQLSQCKRFMMSPGKVFDSNKTKLIKVCVCQADEKARLHATEHLFRLFGIWGFIIHGMMHPKNIPNKLWENQNILFNFFSSSSLEHSLFVAVASEYFQSVSIWVYVCLCDQVGEGKDKMDGWLLLIWRKNQRTREEKHICH